MGVRSMPPPDQQLVAEHHRPAVIDHANPVRFRNIWVRRLGEYDKP